MRGGQEFVNMDGGKIPDSRPILFSALVEVGTNTIKSKTCGETLSIFCALESS